MESLVIRPAKSDEEALACVMPLALGNSWNIKTERITLCRKIHPSNILLALISDQAVGCVITFAYHNQTAGLGYLMVKEAWRNKGIATKLVQTAVQSLLQRDISSICLTASSALVPFYTKQGFVGTDQAVTTWRSMARPVSAKLDHVSEERPSVSELSASDLAHTGFYRPQLWSGLLKQSARFFCIYCGSDLQAWTIFEKETLSLSPLYAKTYEQAKELVLYAMEACDGESEVEAYSTPNSEKLFRELGFEKTSEASYMWFGPRPDVAKGMDEEVYVIYDAAFG